MVEAYLQRPNLKIVTLLIDIRRGPATEEDDLLAWFREMKVPVVVALTKVDKLAKSKRKPVVARMTPELGVAPVLCSSLTGDGISQLSSAIGKHL